MGQNIRKKGVFRARPRNKFSKFFMKKPLRKSKKALYIFFHIRLVLTSAKLVHCSLKTVGGDSIWKSPFFSLKKHVLHRCGKMGKMKKIKKLHSLYFCPPTMPAKFQQCRIKIVEKVPRRGGSSLNIHAMVENVSD